MNARRPFHGSAGIMLARNAVGRASLVALLSLVAVAQAGTITPIADIQTNLHTY
jgi:hypothetical protein